MTSYSRNYHLKLFVCFVIQFNFDNSYQKYQAVHSVIMACFFVVFFGMNLKIGSIKYCLAHAFGDTSVIDIASPHVE